jgi:hypothetical protein
MRRRLIDRDETTYGIGSGPLATLGAGFGLWARNLLPLTGFALIPAAATLLVEVAVTAWLGDRGMPTDDLRNAATMAATLLTFPLAYGATAATYLLLDSRVRDTEPKTGAIGFYGRGLKLFGRLFGVFFMLGLALLAPLVPAAVLWRLDLVYAAIPLVAIGAAFDVWLLVRWSLAAPVAVLEDATFSVAFARSKTLVKGAWWKTFATLLLIGLAIALLAAGIWQAGSAIGDLAEVDQSNAQSLANLAIGVVTTAPLDCVLFALYAALRDRERSAGEPAAR